MATEKPKYDIRTFCEMVGFQPRLAAALQRKYKVRISTEGSWRRLLKEYL